MKWRSLGITVTPQGVDDRINAFSVAFLRAIFLQALEIFKNKCPLPLSVLQQFSAINIVDSSTKSLPENMADEYPGCGRVGAKAALKIQLVFDFLHGNLKQVEIASVGRSNSFSNFGRVIVVSTISRRGAENES